MTARPSGTSGLFASPSPWSLLTAARWLPTRFRLDSPDSPPCRSPERAHVGRTFPHLCDPRRFGKVRKDVGTDRKSTRLNSSHSQISYAVFCLKKKKNTTNLLLRQL